MKIVILSTLALVALASTAEARSGLHPECNVTMPCTNPSASTPDQVLTARGRFIAREVGFGGPVVRRAVRAPKARRGAS